MEMEIDFADILGQTVELNASDLHMTVGSSPMVRIRGELRALENYAPLTSKDTRDLIYAILSNDQRKRLETEWQVDFSYSVPAKGRFRVNAYMQRASLGAAFRLIPSEIKSIEQLGLPPVTAEVADEERGIILLTGTTGSGKSSTLAAMIDQINRFHSKHIVTIEDPIEFLHRDKRSIINQREVGADTTSFKRALRRVLRQDPDVILVGEMRDEETVSTALSAAETGHLVLSTLHTVDAPETINRIIDFFPPHMNQQVRSMLAGTLKAIVSQRLIKRADGEGRVACCEILRMTARVRDMIMAPEETGKLGDAIAEGGYYGMQTFDQALLNHVQHGRVTMDEAVRAATSPHDFKLMVASDGHRSTSVEQLMSIERDPSPAL